MRNTIIYIRHTSWTYTLDWDLVQLCKWKVKWLKPLIDSAKVEFNRPGSRAVRIWCNVASFALRESLYTACYLFYNWLSNTPSISLPGVATFLVLLNILILIFTDRTDDAPRKARTVCVRRMKFWRRKGHYHWTGHTFFTIWLQFYGRNSFIYS